MMSVVTLDRANKVLENYKYFLPFIDAKDRELIAVILTVALKLEEVGDVLESLDTTINEK